jgi:hypothetical protein
MNSHPENIFMGFIMPGKAEASQHIALREVFIRQIDLQPPCSMRKKLLNK